MSIFFDFVTEKLLGVAKRGWLAKIVAWAGIGLLTAISLLYSYDRLTEFVDFYF
ncbi:hypothetical protein [Phyllobacterium zundukense]|uniref:hypothetical protein n=1 Tax=Phyllobacterium zundukense TaxID=1867719 RepID=UPI0012FFEA68|nr:hypothetical protein [Phyllobacterium zundukense]